MGAVHSGCAHGPQETPCSNVKFTTFVPSVSPAVRSVRVSADRMAAGLGRVQLKALTEVGEALEFAGIESLATRSGIAARAERRGLHWPR